ncbi:hypothetical protein CBL_04878 [Carabus blaptoides fortunei]
MKLLLRHTKCMFVKPPLGDINGRQESWQRRTRLCKHRKVFRVWIASLVAQISTTPAYVSIYFRTSVTLKPSAALAVVVRDWVVLMTPSILLCIIPVSLLTLSDCNFMS